MGQYVAKDEVIWEEDDAIADANFAASGSTAVVDPIIQRFMITWCRALPEGFLSAIDSCWGEFEQIFDVERKFCEREPENLKVILEFNAMKWRLGGSLDSNDCSAPRNPGWQLLTTALAMRFNSLVPDWAAEPVSDAIEKYICESTPLDKTLGLKSGIGKSNWRTRFRLDERDVSLKFGISRLIAGGELEADAIRIAVDELNISSSTEKYHLGPDYILDQWNRHWRAQCQTLIELYRLELA